MNRAEYKRQWYLKNKDKNREASRKWREANKNYQKEFYESRKQEYYSVYTLPYANYYVGYTKGLQHRMDGHKTRGNDTTDYIVLHKTSTAKEAKEYEKIYHDIGFPGK